MYEFHTILKQLEIPVHFIDQYIFDVIKTAQQKYISNRKIYFNLE